MTYQEKLNLCRYYKGEQECPFGFGSSKGIFWQLEQQYYFSVDWDYSSYNRQADNYIKEHSDEKNFMTSDAPLYQKGFVMFAEAMLEKWGFIDLSIIFEYGKE